MALRRLALSLASLALALPSFAQTHTWTGNGTSTDISVWNTATNWDGVGIPPADSTGTIVFGPSNRYEVSLGGARSVGALSFTGIGAYTIYDGDLTLTTGSLTSDGQANHYFAGNIALGANGVFTVNTGWPFRMVGVISDGGGSRSLTKTGHGTLELWAANTYSGTTILDRGTLALGNDGALSTGTVFIGNGATLTAIGGHRTIANTINVTTGAIFNIDSSSLTLNGGLTGTAAIHKQGEGTLTLNGTAVRTSGDFVLEAGTLAIGNDYAIGSAFPNTGTTSARLVTYGGTLTAVGADRSLFGDFVINSGTLEVNLGQYNLSTSAIIAGAGTLLKTGTGTFSLLQNLNQFTGETVIQEGKLAIRYGATSANNWGGLGKGLVTLAGGTLGHVSSADATSLNNPFRLAGSSAFEFLTPVTLNGSFTLAGSHTLAMNMTVVFAGGITEENGSHTFIKTGPGTALLNGINTYTGGTIVNSGLLMLGDGGNHLPTTSRVTVNGGTFWLGAADQTLGSLDGSGGFIALFNGMGRTLTLIGSDTAASSSAITGDGAQLIKAGSGTQTLGGASTYSGGTTINAGTLLVASNSALGTGTVTLNGGKLGATGGDQTIANEVVLNTHTTFTGDSRLTLAGNFTLARTFELGVDAGSTLAISGTIVQSGGARTLQKYGAGTLELTGANTYTGGTLIADGTVRINNSTGSAFGTGAVTIDTAGTLTGVGFFTGALQNNGTYAPGNSPALQSLSSFSQGPTGRLQLEIGGLVRGTGYDALEIGGASFLDGTLELAFYGGFSAADLHVGDNFDFFHWNGVNGAFAFLDFPTLTGGLAWDTSQLYTTGAVSITASPIPEPSTYAALTGLASLGLALWRRRARTRRSIQPPLSA